MSVTKNRRKESKVFYVYNAYNIADTVEGWSMYFPEAFYRTYAEGMVEEAEKLSDYTIRLNRIWGGDVTKLEYRLIYANRAISQVDSIEARMERCFRRTREMLPRMEHPITGVPLSENQRYRKIESTITKLAFLLMKERNALIRVINSVEKQMKQTGLSLSPKDIEEDLEAELPEELPEELLLKEELLLEEGT